jgi:hypothetical protein
MKILKNWCVGYDNKGELKLVFRADFDIEDKAYIVDYLIKVEKDKEYEIQRRPDLLIMSYVGNIEYEMIVEVDADRRMFIKNRLENDQEFKNLITHVLKSDLLGNKIHINFELESLIDILKAKHLLE